VTYVSLPDGATLPAEQPAEIAGSIQTTAPTAAQLLDIANASPHVQLIRQQVRDKIAQSYSIADEIKLLRTAPSAEHAAYNEFVESCRAWGRAQKALLGL